MKIGPVEFQIIEFECWRPYDGLIQGVPTRHFNRWILRACQTRATKDRPRRRTTLIEPAIDRVRTDRVSESVRDHYRQRRKEVEYLPEYCCIVWLRSFQTLVDHDATGSEACLIWFQSAEDFALSLPELIKRALDDRTWADIAEDWVYYP